MRNTQGNGDKTGDYMINLLALSFLSLQPLLPRYSVHFVHMIPRLLASFILYSLWSPLLPFHSSLVREAGEARPLRGEPHERDGNGMRKGRVEPIESSRSCGLRQGIRLEFFIHFWCSWSRISCPLVLWFGAPLVVPRRSFSTPYAPFLSLQSRRAKPGRARSGVERPAEGGTTGAPVNEGTTETTNGRRRLNQENRREPHE